jgi:aryl-alcohol dehydrogenase-like predicted oxidoreductase
MADLPKRQLGRTGLQVTALGFGGSHLRGPPDDREISEVEAGKLLNGVLDAGINFIDTARAYGRSEARIGRHLSQRRSEFYLATKCGGSNLTRAGITESVNESLTNLQTDYIDVLQFHNSPSRQQLEENGAIETMKDLQKEGKIRFFGISGTLPHLKDQIEMGVFDTFQVPYSALRHDHEDLIRQASAAGAGIIIRNGVASGGPDRRGSPYRDAWANSRLEELIGDMSRMEFLLRFTLSNPDLDSTIVGTLNPDHVQDNVNALLKGPLPPDVYAEALQRSHSVESVGSVGYLRPGRG